jgi:hypothetical protein
MAILSEARPLPEDEKDNPLRLPNLNDDNETLWEWLVLSYPDGKEVGGNKTQTELGGTEKRIKERKRGHQIKRIERWLKSRGESCFLMKLSFISS